MLTGQRIVKEVGIGRIPTFNVENACSSGATALHLAWKSVCSGEHAVALVIGVDKLTQFGGGTLPLVAEDIEVRYGMVMPALYAMRARRYPY
jgi:benzoylsuccinyl-CoA thiolase BbsB subunit